jgi:4-aminobutyrate aminotransferase-like enzyme
MKGEEWSRRGIASFSPGYTSNLFPGFIRVKAEGVHITDIDGNRYIDFTAQRANVGHSHPRLIQAVKQQIMEGGLLVGELPKIILAEKIKEIVPNGLSNGIVNFFRGGTPAVEKAILTIRSFSKKRIFLGFQGSYHGGTLASLSMTFFSSHYRKGLSPMSPDVVYAPFGNCYRCVFGEKYPGCGFLCVEYIQYVLETVADPEDVAAIFLEPIQADGGVVVPPDEYFRQIKKICDKYEILLVDDEVVTGFGRTGTFFGIESSGVTPDLMIMGKPMASGLDLGAVIGRKEIMEARPENYGNPVSCAAAIETINIILDENLTENASRLGGYIIKRLKEMQETYEIIGDVRGRGLFIGIELVTDRKCKKPATKEAREIIRECYRNGLLLINGGTYKQVLRLTPPLNISRSEVDYALQIMDKTFREYNSKK